MQGKDGGCDEAGEGGRGDVGAVHDGDAGGDFGPGVEARDDVDGSWVYEESARLPPEHPGRSGNVTHRKALRWRQG